MRYNYYELSSDSLDLCKGKLTPGVTATWGEIAGNIETQKDLVSYISAHGTASWGSISGSITDQTDLIEYTDRFATTAWVQEQGYLTEHQDLTGYATESWVSAQGYITTSALSGYATESWVSSQGYLVSDDLSQYATRQWVTGRGYITTSALSGYATESWVSAQGYYKFGSLNTPVSTHDYLNDPDFSVPSEFPWEFTGSIVGMDINDLYIGGFFPVELEPGVEYTEFGGLHITPYDLTWYMVTPYDDGEGLQYAVEDIPFVKQNDLEGYLGSYATKSWVSSKGYITTSALSSYATQSWVESQGYLVNEPGNPYQTQADLNNFATYLKNYDLPNAGFITQSWVSSQNYLQESSATIQSLAARLSALETNYGDALSITNNILS